MPLTEYDALSVLTASAIQLYMPGARSDPFTFARMCNRFRLGVESPGAYKDYVQYARAKRKEAAAKEKGAAALLLRRGGRRASPIARKRRRKPAAATTPATPATVEEPADA